MTPSSAKAARHFLFIVIAIIAGAAYRLDFLNANSFAIDSDEAIVGLMAKHILEGKPTPVFYYGQHYMGSGEAIVVAGLAALCGLGTITLKLVPLIFALLLIWSTYEIAEELGGEFAGWSAGLLMAIPPLSLLDWSTKARGGFIELLYLGSLILLFSLHALKRGMPKYETVLLGLLAGVGWWTNNQVLYFFPSLLVFFLLALRSQGPAALTQHFLLGTVSFFVGSLPFWFYNWNHDFASFGIFERATPAEFLEHLGKFFTVSMPILLGAKRFWVTSDIFPGATLLYGLSYVTLLVLAFIKLPWPGRLQGNFLGKVFLGVFLISVPLIFSVSSFGALTDAPRYALPLYIAVFSCAGKALAKIFRFSKVAAVSVLLLLLSLNVVSQFFGGRALPGEPLVGPNSRVAKDQRPVTEWLVQNKVPWVRTNYWIGYRLAFESMEQVRFLVHGNPLRVRIPEYEEQAEAKFRRWTYPVLTVPGMLAKEAEALTTFGYSYTRRDLGSYVLLDRITPLWSAAEEERIAADDLVVTTTLHQENARKMLDGDWNTRWATAEPQKRMTEVRLELRQPREINAIHSVVAQWSSDWPRGLEVYFESPDGKLSELGIAKKYTRARAIVSDEPDLWLWFPPRLVKSVIFRDLEESKKFDWSIAELELYAPKGPVSQPTQTGSRG